MAPLPPKQNGIFKKILKCYDYKQNKMGLKLTKQILSNPETANHGETLSMKGLILNCMGKKEEAYEYVRKGLRNDLTSHVCWHVYGLLQRSDHKYDEAIKCYRNALKYDKENITILRDLSLLQIQMRDLEGFCETRYQLFRLRAAQRVSWISFAVAYHLLNDFSTAVDILDEFRKTQKQQKEQNSSANSSKHPEPIDYEQSELFLYQVMILDEAKNYKEALDFLNKNASQICDRLAVLEYKAEFLINLGRNNEAVVLLQDQLIHRNQENYKYYQMLERAYNIDPNNEAARLSLYKNIQQKYPRSQVPFKIPLNFLDTPDLFRATIDEYMRKSIRKCLPALFRNLKPVYDKEYQKVVTRVNKEYSEQISLTSSKEAQKDLSYIESGSTRPEARQIRKMVLDRYGVPDKIKIIENLMLSYEKNLQDNLSFDSDPSTKDSENKTIVLWVFYFLAQHYDYLGDYEKALEYIKKAMEHTPTLIELLTTRGKIYKHMGEIEKAVEQVDEAQRLDTADRYLNSKCAKYLLRANKIPHAEAICAKFTRIGAPVNETLNEMQCMWFIIETAHAYHRMNKLGMALKKCYEVDAFFTEVTEDQFDFHTYCMRKMTLRAYVRLLRMEDVLRSHKFYFDAAQLAINIYLKLYDEPLVEGKENQDADSNANKLSAAELKKIRNKERKAAAKQQQNQKHSNTNKNADGDIASKGGANKAQKNDQPGNKQTHSNETPANLNDASGMDPNELEHPKDPLEKAIRFLTPLKNLARERLDTHLLAFEVYRRKNKLLLMLQSVKRAQKLDEFHSKVQQQVAQFMQIAESLKRDGKLVEPVRKLLEVELPKLRVVSN